MGRERYEVIERTGSEWMVLLLGQCDETSARMIDGCGERVYGENVYSLPSSFFFVSIISFTTPVTSLPRSVQDQYRLFTNWFKRWLGGLVWSLWC